MKCVFGVAEQPVLAGDRARGCIAARVAPSAGATVAHQILEQLLPPGARPRVELALGDGAGEAVEIEPAGEDVATQLTLPAGVALRDEALQLRFFEELRGT